MTQGDPTDLSSPDRQQARERAVRQLMAALGALFAAFVTITAMFFWLDRATQAVAHTHQVRTHTADVMLALSDAEAAQRSFLLTGDPHSLRQVSDSRAAAQAKTVALERLTRESREQHQRALRLRAAVDARIAVLDRIFALSQAGDAAGAVRIVMSDEGLAAMATVRGLSAELSAVEADLEQRRATRGRTIAALLVLALIAFTLTIAWLFVKMNRDISLDREHEAERAERLRGLLQERTLLIDEMNHRVKNSLQQVASVVRLQSRALEPGVAREALEKTLSRIMAVGRVHERLYKADGELGRFDAGGYAEDLARELIDSMARDDITLTTDIEHAELDARQAAPLALILNELVTNALKYGCPAGRPGKIRVGFRTVGGGYRLSVSDEGDGLPNGFSPKSKASLGMRAVEALARQLDGQLKVEPSAHGATFAVEFPRRPE